MQPEIQTVAVFSGGQRTSWRLPGFCFYKRVALPPAGAERGVLRELTVEVWRMVGPKKEAFLAVTARVEECPGQTRAPISVRGDFYKVIAREAAGPISKAAVTKLFNEVVTDERVRELAAEAVAFYRARQLT